VEANILAAGFELARVHPASSLELTGFLCVWQQEESNDLRVSIMHWEGGATKQNYDFVLDGDFQGVSGTHLTAVTRPSGDGSERMFIFYQVKGDDITELSHNMSHDSKETQPWSETALSVYYLD